MPMLVIDRHAAVDDVHRVESAAKTDLEHRRIDARATKHEQRDEHTELEVGERRFAAGVFDRRKRVAQRRVIDGLAVHSYPFIESTQMRRQGRADAAAISEQ